MKESLKATGRIDVSVYDPDEFTGLNEREQQLLSLNPDLFDMDELEERRDLSDEERELAETKLDPLTTDVTYNTTTIGLHEYIVDNLDAGQNTDESAAYLALGDGDDPEDKNNRSLNNEIYRKEVSDHADNGNELITSTFLGSDDAQNSTIREVALFSDDSGGTMFNHSTIPEIVKDRTNTMSINIVLSFDSS